MTKIEFIDVLARKLSRMPKNDLKQTIDYYYEIITDKVNDGMSEEEAVASLGSIEEIVEATLSDISLSDPDSEKINDIKKTRKNTNWKSITIGATAIIWVPILIGLIGGAIGLYVSLWAIVVSFGATSLATGAGTLVTISGIIDVCTGSIGSGLTWIAIGIGSLGLCFIFYAITIYSGKLMTLLTKKIFTLNKKNRGEKHEDK